MRRRAWLIGAGLVILLFAGSAWLYRNRIRRLFPEGEPGIRLFVDRAPTAAELKSLYTGVKYEPRYGCYLGAYIDLDPNLRTQVKDRTGRRHKDPAEFERRVGKEHALYFFYQLYGARTFPIDWVEKLASQGKFVQIALEPNRGLDAVKDDAYLRNLADKLGKSKAKIFLRFASEMNGPWTAYHGDPAKYIEKWRLVTRVMRARAPNVAMVWCPYMTPQSLIDRYYPGDDWVDWVGVNMYSVTYYNQDRRFPGIDDHPADMLRYVYDRYSARKPIMICEYGAASYSALEGTDTTSFAVENIQALYWSLPRMFPRVKCVTYFSSNNMAVAHRRNNDYSLLSKQAVLAAYSQAISPGYFISRAGQQSGEYGPFPIQYGEAVGGGVSVWARSPQRSALVEILFDGGSIYRRQGIEHSLPQWPNRDGEVTTRLYDRDRALLREGRLKVKRDLPMR